MSMTTKEEEQQTSLLDMVTYTYDTEIANYSLDEYEDLLDEDEVGLLVGEAVIFERNSCQSPSTPTWVALKFGGTELAL